jgi:uncharacterized protein
MTDEQERPTYPVAIFFVSTFAIAWGIWIPAGRLFPNRASAFVLLGAWAPTIAAVLLTAFTDGATGVRTLLRGLLKWRVAPRWYFFAIAGPTLAALIAIGLHVMFGGSGPTLASVANRVGIPAQHARWVLPLLPLLYIVTLVAGGPIAEEVGWRGFAQARLQASLGSALAGVTVGLVWSFWHLPLFYLFPSAMGGIPLPYYVPLMTSSGVLFGMIYRATGSVLLCVLFHGGLNFALGTLGLIGGAADLMPVRLFVGLWAALATVAFVRLKSDETAARAAIS